MEPQKNDPKQGKKDGHESVDKGEQGGKQIQDYYITKQRLGKGAYGSVFIAYKLTKEGKKNGKYAAKVIQLSSLNDKEVIQLTREIEILQSIRHNNVIRMEHVTRTKNNLYIFLEYIRDGDLCKYLENHKRLSEAETLFFFRQICEGFKELYKCNIIHRDIKPENILLQSRDSVKQIIISDFGFARVLSQDQMNKQIEQTPVGSLRYMAPQILGVINFSCKCDVWSLGVMIYECLYGQPPWMDDTYLRLLNKILNVPLTFPSNVSVRRDLQELLSRMMTIDEEKRISWDELFLHPLLNDNPELFTNFNVSNQYVSREIQKIQERQDLQEIIEESKIAAIANQEEKGLTQNLCEYLALQRQVMLFITSTLQDLFKFQACSSFRVPEIMYHKMLLLLQKQQQIVREQLMSIIDGGEAKLSQEVSLSPENLAKLIDSPCFKYVNNLRSKDDDQIMPFFLSLFVSSSAYLTANNEEEFVTSLTQKLKFTDIQFQNRHKTELLKFLSLAKASINKKQNLYKNVLIALYKLIICVEQEKRLTWESRASSNSQTMISAMFCEIPLRDTVLLENEIKNYLAQNLPGGEICLADSPQIDSITSSIERLQISM